MNAYREVEGLLHSLITSELVINKWSVSNNSRFNPWKETQYPLSMRLYGTQKRSGLLKKRSTSYLYGESKAVSSRSWPTHYTELKTPTSNY
jgi:hypothetical protein